MGHESIRFASQIMRESAFFFFNGGLTMVDLHINHISKKIIRQTQWAWSWAKKSLATDPLTLNVYKKMWKSHGETRSENDLQNAGGSPHRTVTGGYQYPSFST